MKFGSVQIKCSKCLNVSGKGDVAIRGKKKFSARFRKKEWKEMWFCKKCKTNISVSLRHLYIVHVSQMQSEAPRLQMSHTVSQLSRGSSLQELILVTVFLNDTVSLMARQTLIRTYITDEFDLLA